jgi:hypothetical protein
VQLPQQGLSLGAAAMAAHLDTNFHQLLGHQITTMLGSVHICSSVSCPPA